MIDEKKLANAAMSDDELDNVAGGFSGDTARDSQFLYEHGLVDDYSANGLSILLKWNSESAAVDAGWSKAGITCVTKPCKDNLYFKDGKQITHDEAIAHVQANFQKIRSID